MRSRKRLTLILEFFVGVLALALSAMPAVGQCPGGVCPAVPDTHRSPQIYQPAPNQPTPAWRYEQASGYRAAVARIVTYDRDGAQSMGSGVLVSYRGRSVILTAWHVIKTARKITVWLTSGRWFDATVLQTDSTWDCAVLDIGDAEGIQAAELEYGEEGHPKSGDRLESAGYGDGKLAVNQGYFLGYSRPTNSSGPTDWLRLSGYARQGDSGGPIFNSRGRVVGILWGTDGRQVVGTQLGRLHQILASAVKTAPAEKPLTGQLADQKRLPICRPLVPVPQPTPQPAPAPPVVVQSDPAVGRALQSIDAKLDVIAANTQPKQAEVVAPKTASLSPLLVGLVILGSAICGFVAYFGTQKG